MAEENELSLEDELAKLDTELKTYESELKKAIGG